MRTSTSSGSTENHRLQQQQLLLQQKKQQQQQQQSRNESIETSFSSLNTTITTTSGGVDTSSSSSISVAAHHHNHNNKKQFSSQQSSSSFRNVGLETWEQVREAWRQPTGSGSSNKGKGSKRNKLPPYPSKSYRREVKKGIQNYRELKLRVRTVRVIVYLFERLLLLLDYSGSIFFLI